MLTSGHENAPGRLPHNRGVALVVGCTYRAGGFPGERRTGRPQFAVSCELGLVCGRPCDCTRVCL
jgi:hypothetical protein